VSGLPRLRPEILGAEQRSLYDAVLRSPRAAVAGRAHLVRDDGSLTGPFDAWLRSPAVGALLERVGMALRTNTVLPADAREVAVLVVAEAWGSDFEWRVHRMLAGAAGVPQEVIEAVGAQRPLPGAAPVVIAAHDIAFDLVHERRIRPATFDVALAALGERGLVEVVVTVGFYQLVSGTLATGAADLAAGARG
jgi:4-carboxymuconolactone decarboxylase